MKRSVSESLFFLLACSQALHSLEEYRFELWNYLEPARYLSSLVSDDLSFGFAVINISIVVLFFLTYFGPVRRQSRAARPLMWFWVGLEMINGVGHSLFAINAGGYFPGVYTAPLLILFSGALIYRHNEWNRPSSV